MDQIWKFTLEPDAPVLMPENARPLHVAEQHDKLCLWALCDVGAPKKPRKFIIVGTGHVVPERIGAFIGSALMMGGSLVLHVFDQPHGETA